MGPWGADFTREGGTPSGGSWTQVICLLLFGAMLRLQNSHVKGLTAKIFILKELLGIKYEKPQLALGFFAIYLEYSRFLVFGKKMIGAGCEFYGGPAARSSGKTFGAVRCAESLKTGPDRRLLQLPYPSPDAAAPRQGRTSGLRRRGGATRARSGGRGDESRSKGEGQEGQLTLSRSCPISLRQANSGRLEFSMSLTGRQELQSHFG